ncbi:hypothetical protein [Kitasatospora sp. NPDC057015]|uniref:hypothetical protein n=1 Tax=Kitasatospora sp. NPDC057015 TaxID=3346001 RepID=UPI00363BE510
MGLVEVHLRNIEVQEADACAQKSLANHSLSHCGHEDLFAGSKSNTPEQIMDAWFKSPLHKEALTYASSRNAGPAIAIDSSGNLVAAFNIDY